MAHNFLELWWTDSYKTSHRSMLPAGSTMMNSNNTPRSSKLANFPNSKGIIAFGAQKLVREMKEDWDLNFFQRPIEEIDQFGADLTAHLMLKEPYDVSHFKALHKLGYLPLRVKAIEEGTFLPYRIPMTTIVNTQPLNNQVFDWLVNYLETINSAEAWQMPTSATLGFQFKKLGRARALRTDSENLWFVDYQFHDFSMRGMGGKSAIVNSSLGFAACSRGSDTLPVIPAARKFYDEVDVCVNSVIASEHAIMCALTGFFIKQKDGTWDRIGDFEYETFLYLIKKFPSGILSLVMDTWDLWRAVTDYVKRAKDEIMARDGKVVIRPDSGNPVDIICGIPTVTSLWFNELPNTFIYDEKVYKKDKDAYQDTLEEYGENDLGLGDLKRMLDNGFIQEIEMAEAPRKGVIELLHDTFGGTITKEGFKKLDSHIGAIYGDSITLARAEAIFDRLETKGFASTNIVLGVGSYSLQYVTRDTHGFAQKATFVVVNGQGIEIFKDPATDDGTKKSARGLLCVFKDENGEYYLKDRATPEEEQTGYLQVIFEDGKFYNQTTLTEIRDRINNLKQLND